jgi:hypothetical protein
LLRHRRHSCDEPVTSAGDGFYETRLLRIVLEHSPDIADGSLQYRVAHETVTPNLIQQGVLRQQSAWMTRESAKQSEGSRRKRQCAATAQEERIRFVELELTEAHAQGT